MSNEKLLKALEAYNKLSRIEQRLFLIEIRKRSSKHTKPASSGIAFQHKIRKSETHHGTMSYSGVDPKGATINFGPRPKRTNDNEDDIQD
ncbi:hypothetical protein OW493_13260 [Cobetia sp. 14N.309.X.WAT.E.A4]|uniref:hypothetical protein n=1 Tax=Cobetia sp. 14N.309.X.WAT.E.A4 TaxID=2998323 RepID=UPI0025B1C6A1|nr:hypothetical protein [Cobetia sp. 14N.309.X.WAT.E.A4]MDN2657417.1 hypothetical protein [Cobetia sp. 14N.309.X.WAT.E.A4]